MFGQQLTDPVAGSELLTSISVSRAMVPAFSFAGPCGLEHLAQFGENVIGAHNR